MVDNLDERLEELDGQVRKEMDLRIIGLMMEIQKRAAQVLSPEQQAAFNAHLGTILEAPPEAALPVPALAALEALEEDTAAGDLLERLRGLVQTKFKAEEILNAPGRPTLHALLRKSGYADLGLSDKPSSTHARAA